jgi:hypothetical protein
MAALEPRNSFRIADEQEWLESSDIVDVLPASVWTPDYEEEDDETTLREKRVDAQHIDVDIDLMSPTLEQASPVVDPPHEVRILDESQVRPEDKRLDAHYIDLMSPNLEQESPVVDPPRQVRILDESQVLPREASFATVNLNQPLEESVLKPHNSWEPIPTSSVDDYREPRAASRVQLLDESQVLSDEASFATVMLGQRPEAHSPITEFLVKTKLSLKQVVLAMLALVSVLALAVIVLLSMTSSKVVTVSSAPQQTTLNATRQTANQSVSTSVTESRESALISNSQGKESGSVSATQPVATVEKTQGVAEAKLVERATSDDSRKATSSDAKSRAVQQGTLREVNPVREPVNAPKVIETKKQSAQSAQSASLAKKAVKKPQVVKTPKPSVSSEPRETLPKPASRLSEVPVTVEKVETKTPPTNGGGERPRTVTRKPNP